MIPVQAHCKRLSGLFSVLVGGVCTLGWLFGVSAALAVQPPEHLEADCISCHDNHQDPPPSPDQLCLDCHEATLAEADLIAGVFHSPEDRSCSRCHGYHATEMLKATGAVFERPFQQAEVLVQCRNCHRENSVVQNVSAGHFQAALQYHVNAGQLQGQGPSEICLECHDQDSGYGQVPGSTPTFPTHGSHPIGVAVPLASPWEASGFRDFVDDSLELVDQKLECGTCHRLPAETVFRLVPFASVTDLCNGCHDMAPGTMPLPGNGGAKRTQVASR